MSDEQFEKVLLRWMVFSTVVVALFWGAWYWITGSVPEIRTVAIFSKELRWELPFAISRWWDVAVTPVAVGMLFLLLRWMEPQVKNDGLIVGLYGGIAFGVLFGCIGGIAFGIAFGIFFGCIGGIAFGVLFELVGGMSLGMFFGLVYGLVYGLISGGFTPGLLLIAPLTIAAAMTSVIAVHMVKTTYSYVFCKETWKNFGKYFAGGEEPEASL